MTEAPPSMFSPFQCEVFRCHRAACGPRVSALRTQTSGGALTHHPVDAAHKHIQCAQLLTLLKNVFYNLPLAGGTHLGRAHPRLEVCPKGVVCCVGEPLQIWDVEAYRGRAQHGDGGTSFLFLKQRGFCAFKRITTTLILWLFSGVGGCASLLHY